MSDLTDLKRGASGVFLIGKGGVQRITAPRGETPPCPDATFKRGDVVKVRRSKEVGHFPPDRAGLRLPLRGNGGWSCPCLTAR